MLWAVEIAGSDVSSLMVAVLTVWLFAVGGAIGSFMNVVVYRAPAGMSIVYPPSHCPACKHPIRGYHNLPVLGWLLLRGKCYDCGARISPRYPLVEGMFGLVFVALAWVELFSGAANLPQRGEGGSETGFLGLWAVYGYHCLLCTGLLCAALMEFDGNRMPRRIFLPLLVAGLGLPLIWPELRPVAGLDVVIEWLPRTRALVGMIDGACGVIMAVLLVWPATIALARQSAKRWTAGAALILVGAYLGWQAVAVLACATAFLYLSLAALGRIWPALGKVPWSCVLVLLTLGWLVNWQWLVSRLPYLG